jgi:hypothetical protein
MVPMISTRSLAAFPSVTELVRVTKGLAALDAILCEDWESRSWSFNATWGDKSMMASMRDGSGDEMFILFSPAGTVIKGFAHESAMSPFRPKAKNEKQRGIALYPGVLSGFPVALESFLEEPSFIMEETTFVIWRLGKAKAWSIGDIAWPKAKDPDGSEALLAPLLGDTSSYVKFADEVYEKKIKKADVAHVLANEPLSAALVQRLRSKRSLLELADDLAEIGYA